MAHQVAERRDLEKVRFCEKWRMLKTNLRLKKSFLKVLKNCLARFQNTAVFRGLVLEISHHIRSRG
jgi:hypothetical protein